MSDNPDPIRPSTSDDDAVIRRRSEQETARELSVDRSETRPPGEAPGGAEGGDHSPSADVPPGAPADDQAPTGDTDQHSDDERVG